MSAVLNPVHRGRKTALPAGEREVWLAKDIMLRWNISATTFWRYRKRGLIPKPNRRIGTRMAWSRDVVLAAERVEGTA